MRELKFRVYDPEQKKMRYWGFIDGVFISPPLDSGALSWPSMQFVGFHDKNGKEIYEGDIIKQGKDGNKYNGRLGFVEYVTDNSNGVPVNGYWYRSGTDSASTIWPKEAEVIGNVHQTPELCKN